MLGMHQTWATNPKLGGLSYVVTFFDSSQQKIRSWRGSDDRLNKYIVFIGIP